VSRLALLVPLLAVLAFPSAAFADKEVVTGQGCDCFAPAQVTMDQGERLTFRNADLLKGHDLRSEAMAPNGTAPLFSAPEIGPGTSAFVEGSQYLTTGTYDFVCTLHAGMDGKLNVTALGTPVPRPSGGGQTTPPDGTAPGVKLKVGALKASRLAKSRRIRAVVQVDESSVVTLVASIGSKRIGSVKGELFKGTPTDLEIRVSRKNARLLKKGRQLTLAAVAEDPAGNKGQASLAKKLR
jgi:plastocyanin